MDEYTVKRLALVLAVQAEIEGMKLKNDNRKLIGRGAAFSPDDFYGKAEELRILASKHNEEL